MDLEWRLRVDASTERDATGLFLVWAGLLERAVAIDTGASLPSNFFLSLWHWMDHDLSEFSTFSASSSKKEPCIQFGCALLNSTACKRRFG